MRYLDDECKGSVFFLALFDVRSMIEGKLSGKR